MKRLLYKITLKCPAEMSLKSCTKVLLSLHLHPFVYHGYVKKKIQSIPTQIYYTYNLAKSGKLTSYVNLQKFWISSQSKQLKKAKCPCPSSTYHRHYQALILYISLFLSLIFFKNSLLPWPANWLQGAPINSKP